MMEMAVEEHEPQAPLAIRGAYQAAMQVSGQLAVDSYAHLRRRVVQAMQKKRQSKAYITEKQRLAAVDVESLLWQADALHMLQGEVRRLVEARGGTFNGVVGEIMQALQDRDLIVRAEMAALSIHPVMSPDGVVVTGWVASQMRDPNHLDRPHRTLREAMIHALHPIEPLESGADTL